MIKRLGFLLVFLSLVTVGIAGCGEPAGVEGDGNDPAASSDDEQMQDETGDNVEPPTGDDGGDDGV